MQLKNRRQERTNVFILVEQSAFNSKSLISNQCPEHQKSPCQATKKSVLQSHPPSSNAICHTLLVQMNVCPSSQVFTNLLSRELSVVSVSSPSAAASPWTRQSPSEQAKLKAVLNATN